MPNFNSSLWRFLLLVTRSASPLYHSSRILLSRILPFTINAEPFLKWWIMGTCCIRPRIALLFLGFSSTICHTLDHALNSAPASLLAQFSLMSLYQESAFGREKVNASSFPAGSTSAFPHAQLLPTQPPNSKPNWPLKYLVCPLSLALFPHPLFLRRLFAPQLKRWTSICWTVLYRCLRLIRFLGWESKAERADEIFERSVGLWTGRLSRKQL
jgi:hypothetical protein